MRHIRAKQGASKPIRRGRKEDQSFHEIKDFFDFKFQKIHVRNTKIGVGRRCFDQYYRTI
jgi:hypothetical protein